jgi:hypothetical protein
LADATNTLEQQVEQSLTASASPTSTPDAATQPAAAPTTDATAALGDATPAPADQPAAGAPATPAEQASLIEYARQLGVDPGNVTDDRAFFQQLLLNHREAERLRQLQPQLQEYLQHAGDFQQWRQSRQPAAAPAQQPAWNPPASRQDVERLVARHYERDAATGALKPKADAPADVVRKVAEFTNYVEDWRDRLTYDPAGAINALIGDQIDQRVRQHLGGYNETLQAQDILRQNAALLYAHDPLTGQHRLTEAGRQYAETVRLLEQNGRDIRVQNQVARELVELRQKVKTLESGRPAPAPAPGTPVRRPSVAPANGHGGVTAVSPSTAGVALVEQLRANLSAFPDADFASDLN